MTEQIPEVGRIVRYVLPEGRNKGQHRPAIIVKVWDAPTSMVNLDVFMDGLNDEQQHPVQWRHSVHFDMQRTPGSWHWPGIEAPEPELAA
ncbi:hypothetical protein [Candidatus Nitronereus thalassa]|uniref:Uncharacterized protein n=1 Tax=Candidatus Nitronereus thalassa TaxID=3020898 RepID=A0ABU3K3A9_9BACT|nr:hypothetical protein [Candidatus Nitronereus thalassa]MDT7040867.1 hypothetical protein [Candidatus Nitronereus thalassa]